MSDELFSFAEETKLDNDPWNILIVDDEPGVHEVTKLVLGNFRFEERPLKFFHAYSAQEARSILQNTEDLALVLLDVVMEHETAGLDLVRYIRVDLKNSFSRIVLRTGQPGQAPEQDVIANYDINDYKDKTELTAQKLYTTLFATLRAYRDVMIIEQQKRGLERVIQASAQIFSHQKSHEFASAVLNQLTNLLGMRKGALYCKVRDLGGTEPEHFVVAAANGDYQRYVNHFADEDLPSHIAESLRTAYRERQNLFRRDHYVLFFTDSQKSESLLYVGENWQLTDLEYRLVELFCTNVSIAFENLHLNQELFDSQLEMVYMLAGAAETRSKETANHVRRVGVIAEMLGRTYGLTTNECAQLKFAAPLHDIGKIGIPDDILNKPGPHTSEETTVMRTHTQLGAHMLAGSRRPLMILASQIAAEHHENWDGSGYPRGLRGEAISIAGRITSLADVFDALGSQRCYKKPWAEEDIQSFIRSQSGLKFEPKLVELLIGNWEEAQRIRAALPDEE
jgi:response regulator RpfG family c-di-GMP phosphodiesterase